METGKKILIIIPTYNEVENLPMLVQELLKISSSIDLLIIDDNSEDGTGKCADEISNKKSRVHVIHRSGKLGLGSAYIRGFKYALQSDYDYVFEMDADFSHDPKYISKFLERIEKCDLVIGSRYLKGVNVVNWPLKRLILSYTASIYTRIFTGLPVKDPTSGFKCFKREALERIDLDEVRSDGYSFQIEMNFRCWALGMKIEEIPIVFFERDQGNSKMSKKIIFEAIWMVLWLKIQKILKRL